MKSYSDILTSEEHLYLQQVGSMNTENIWAVARLMNNKKKVYKDLSINFIAGAFAQDLQKSRSSVAHYYYTHKFYGEENIARYSGLSYGHLSRAMKYKNWEEILDWCLDENAGVDRMTAHIKELEGDPINYQVLFMEDIENAIGHARHLEIPAEERGMIIAELNDMRRVVVEIAT